MGAGRQGSVEPRTPTLDRREAEDSGEGNPGFPAPALTKHERYNRSAKGRARYARYERTAKGMLRQSRAQADRRKGV